MVNSWQHFDHFSQISINNGWRALLNPEFNRIEICLSKLDFIDLDHFRFINRIGLYRAEHKTKSISNNPCRMFHCTAFFIDLARPLSPLPFTETSRCSLGIMNDIVNFCFSIFFLLASKNESATPFLCHINYSLIQKVNERFHFSFVSGSFHTTDDGGQDVCGNWSGYWHARLNALMFDDFKRT